MTPEQRTLAAAFLAELWPVCHELPRHHREEKRKNDRRMQREMEEREAVNTLSTAFPQPVQNEDRGVA
jgi:hypothetical protein